MNKNKLMMQVFLSHKLKSNFHSLNLCKFYIFVGCSDEFKGCILWDPTPTKSSLAKICIWKNQ
jgi:hypothetical protein